MKKIVLDTNAYTRLLAGDHDALNAISSAETVHISVFVLGELYAGFAGGSKERENKETLKQFLLKSTVKILNAHSRNRGSVRAGEIQPQEIRHPSADQRRLDCGPCAGNRIINRPDPFPLVHDPIPSNCFHAQQRFWLNTTFSQLKTPLQGF